MPTRSRQLTEKGFELLERNLRGKCKSGIRSANTVANKLGPLLQDENVEIECIKSYLTELEQRVSAIVDSQICYDDKFADYPDILAEFYEWFQPRFDTLSSVLSYAREFVSTCNVNMAETILENVDNDFHTDHADNDIRPEDSVSQVSRSHHGRRSVSRTTRSSKASSKTSSKASSHVSSIKSARIKESLRKVSLLAESQTLVKKQELMRKELELSLARESLELSTNLAVATAKEEVLLDAETNSVVDSFARHGSDESVTRVISQSDGLANVDQMETSGVRDGLSVGVDGLSINAVGATASSIDPPVRASPRDTMSVGPSVDTVGATTSSIVPSVRDSPRDIMSVCPSVNAVGATTSIVDLSDKVCLQDISSVCLSDQTSDAFCVAPHHVASETLSGVTCHMPHPSENSQISSRVVRHLPYLFENSHISMHRDDDVRSNEKSAERRLHQVSGRFSTINMTSNVSTTPSCDRPKMSVFQDQVPPAYGYTDLRPDYGEFSAPVNAPVAGGTGYSQLNPFSSVFVPATSSVQQTTGAGSTQHVAGVVDHGFPTFHHNDYSRDGGEGLGFVSHSGGLPVTGAGAWDRHKYETVVDKLSDVLVDPRNRLPEIVIPKFSGDPLDYDSFIRTFDARIASRTNDDSEKMHYLDQYTSGIPKQVVRSCMHIPAGLGYVEARRQLDERFGDRFLLAQTYLKRLETWPTIRKDDVKGLDEFTIFLVGCRNAMSVSDGIRELDYPTSLRLIVSKLPGFLQERWARTADSILHDSRGVLTFGKLVTFLERETRIKRNPVFGKTVVSSDVKSASQKKKSISAATVSKPSTTTNSGVTAASQNVTILKNVCLFCGFSHSFKVCRKLRKVMHKEKIAFLMKHKLCFGCLGDHMKSQCTQKATCDVCKGSHPTLLHRSTATDNNVGQSSGSSSELSHSAPLLGGFVQSNSTVPVVTSAIIQERQSGTDTMPIVPVKVKLASGDLEVLTHAFLDSGSSETFITERLMKQLSASGKKIHINLTTLNNDDILTPCYKVSGMEVCGLNEDCYISLPAVFTQVSLPVSREQIPSQEDIERWPHLSPVVVSSLQAGVDLLIGNNVPKATEPWEVINSVNDGPYAVRTVLGWSINGPLRSPTGSDDWNQAVSCRVQVTSRLEDQIQKFFSLDFSEQFVFSGEKALSVEDKKFMEMVNRETILRDGHYQVCLPLRDASTPMPNNRSLALQRLKGLKKKFQSNKAFRKKYTDFIDDLFVKGHVSQVPDEDLSREDGRVWYLPHHGVMHVRKNKLRVVFDASARFAGSSLNDHLLSGPDLSSSLIGVLVRFRQEPVAFMADLECMFYQVKVPADQRDMLRFLWWPAGDVDKEIVECRMHAHIFGATSSPAVAKFALQKTALDNTSSFSPKAVETVQHSFYVDDCLRSVATVEEAVSLSSELRALTQRGGFRLTQWVSNSREVLNHIPEPERAKNLKEVDLDYEELPSEKALGVLWAVESDSLGCHVSVPDKPVTRRGILSVVSSVYDPLGMVAPFVLQGKVLVQELCRRKLGWDDKIPDEIVLKWQQWLQSLPYLDKFAIPRCYQPEGFGDLASVELHQFADASELGYGCVSFLRLRNQVGEVHCNFAFGKSRVAPLKQMTIPRMELAAAVVAVKVAFQLQTELDFTLENTYFWSDSTSVLGYIRNEKARYNTFVANRVALIREYSSPSQWNYVPTHQNPADEASRGLDGDALLECESWRNGLEFLWKSQSEWPPQPDSYSIDDTDAEVKQVSCGATASHQDSIFSRFMTYFSDWFRLRRVVAVLRRTVLGWKYSVSGDQKGVDPRSVPLNASDIKAAEMVVLRWSQQVHYPEEIKSLKAGSRLKQGKLARLSPVLVQDVLRVGGRLKNSSVSEDTKFPIIISPESPVAESIIRSIHLQMGHGGREQVLSRLRERYWVVQANALTRRVLSKCVVCRRSFGNSLTQMMADLPSDRVSPDLPPFTNTGVDFFGPFHVKQGRSLVKRYGVLFTCLVTRAVHIEMAVSLDTDAFVNALRRFIARRGQVKSMRSDNGTNFVGAERELREAIRGWNQSKIASFLLQRSIDWTFNTPAASHHGGSWERLIRSTRRILAGLLKEQTLIDDGLRTLLSEVESILNSRPLTRSSSDPNDLICLTPNHLLLLKDQPSLPIGVFVKEDSYVRRRWRQVQYLSDLFWKRWVREYLPFLQEKQKWLFPKRNVQVGDIVLVVDPSAPRGSWPLGKVQAVFLMEVAG